MKYKVYLLFFALLFSVGCECPEQSPVKVLTFDRMEIDVAKELATNYKLAYPDYTYGEGKFKHFTVYAMHLKGDNTRSLNDELLEHFPKISFEEKINEKVVHVWIYVGLRLNAEHVPQSGNPSSTKADNDRLFELKTIVSFKDSSNKEKFFEVTNHFIDLRGFGKKPTTSPLTTDMDSNKTANMYVSHNTCNPVCDEATLFQ